MAKSKKTRLLQKTLIIGGALVLVQLGFILYFRSSIGPMAIREVIDRKVESTAGLSPERKEQLRLQLAISDFQIHNGKLPGSLSELVPKYFDAIPIDPQTKKPFAYSVSGSKFFVGEKHITQVASAAAAKTPMPGTAAAELQALEKETLIASLDSGIEQHAYVYDPAGKREPFRPFDLSPGYAAADCIKEPLTCTEIGQLRLSIVISGIDNPRATVQDNAGRGYIVEKGSRIGRNNGEVVEILPDRIKILETTVDFTGEVSTNVVEMVLRTKGQAPQGTGQSPEHRIRRQ